MLSELKTQAREALHGALSEPASYLAPGVGAEAVPTAEQLEAGLSLTVRWHNKLRIVGERSSDDAGIIEGINRLVFNSDQLDALELAMAPRGVISIPGLDKTLRLDYREEGDGPLNVYWSVIEL